MKINEMIPMLRTGRWKAIVKQVGSRRMFCGIERLNKRSRKAQMAYICPPQDLDLLVQQSVMDKPL